MLSNTLKGNWEIYEWKQMNKETSYKNIQKGIYITVLLHYRYDTYALLIQNTNSALLHITDTVLKQEMFVKHVFPPP